jgi:hemolysin D
MKLLEKLNIHNFLNRIDDDSHEFLPIIAEIEQTPMNPLGRTTFWIIITLIFLTILWLFFGKIDVVVTARGKIIPDGEIKIIQPLETGVIKDILVKEGDFVKRGQLLMEINPSVVDPALESAKKVHSQIQSELGRLYNKKSRQEQVLDIISREDYERTLSEISRYEQESSQIQASLKEVEFKSTQQRLVSPVDGYVNTLLVHTIGGVVQPADPILSVVPANSELVAKVRVLNKDIGYIKDGIPVQIKMDTYDFQKYGMIEGIVKKVSKDSVDDEKEGLVYDVYVEPLEKTLQVDGKKLDISTGMSLSAEIKVDKRRIIEFFIYPIIKNWSEGVSIK